MILCATNVILGRYRAISVSNITIIIIIILVWGSHGSVIKGIGLSVLMAELSQNVGTNPDRNPRACVIYCTFTLLYNCTLLLSTQEEYKLPGNSWTSNLWYRLASYPRGNRNICVMPTKLGINTRLMSQCDFAYMVLVWFDLIWFDLIWFDLIWFDLIWFDLICRKAKAHGTANSLKSVSTCWTTLLYHRVSQSSHRLSCKNILHY